MFFALPATASVLVFAAGEGVMAGYAAAFALIGVQFSDMARIASFRKMHSGVDEIQLADRDSARGLTVPISYEGPVRLLLAIVSASALFTVAYFHARAVESEGGEAGSGFWGALAAILALCSLPLLRAKYFRACLSMTSTGVSLRHGSTCRFLRWENIIFVYGSGVNDVAWIAVDGNVDARACGRDFTPMAHRRKQETLDILKTTIFINARTLRANPAPDFGHSSLVRWGVTR